MFLFMLIPCGIHADCKEEVRHLIQYIGDSGCIFVRNGKDYGAAKSMKHLQRKYDHVKQQIKTAEDFINRIASKSSITGKPYKVRCGEREIPSAEWLTRELIRYRQGRERIK